MNKEVKVFKSAKCNELVLVLKDDDGNLACCGEPMKLLKANTTYAANEKHVPVATVNGNVVDVVVGSVEHPMTEEHLVEFIYLETEKGGQIRYLNHTDAPKASFVLAEGDKAVAVYEYCNLHGLWKVEL